MKGVQHKTIEQLELELEQKITQPLKEVGLLPEGYKPHVRFQAKERSKRRTASAENWFPDSDSIRITFVAAEDGVSLPSEPLPATVEQPRPPAPNDPLVGLIHALNRAEARPNFDFVALKWFRDVALVNEGFEWASSEATRQNVLRDAIERRVVLTSKVPNPKSPQFPVTAIRLNRLLPEVKAILGIEGASTPGFAPVHIRGGSLSGTILRERR